MSEQDLMNQHATGLLPASVALQLSPQAIFNLTSAVVAEIAFIIHVEGLFVSLTISL